MRLLATADLHIGLKRFGRQTPEGNSRVIDFGKTLERFVDAALEHDVHFAALCGDNFHTRHPAPRELALFTEQVKRLADAGTQVLILPGNHDGMDTIGDPRSHTLSWMRAAAMPSVHILTTPAVQEITAPTGHMLVVASLPYPHRRGLDTESDDTPDGRVELVSRRVEAAIETMGARARAGAGGRCASIFLGHLSVAAASLGSEQSMRIGWDVTVRREVFRDFDYAFLGHIHRAQRIADNVMYVGSPDYHLFEDAMQTKAFVLADFTEPGIPALSRIDSGARKMYSIELEQDEDGTFPLSILNGWQEGGPMVELVLHATVERPRQAEQSRLRAEVLQAGASFVKIDLDLDLPETRERASITAEDAPEAALEAWIAANEDIPMEPTLTVGKQLIASAMSDAT